MDKLLKCYIIGKDQDSLNRLSAFILGNPELELIGNSCDLLCFSKLDDLDELHPDVVFIDLDGEFVVGDQLPLGLDSFSQVIFYASRKEQAADVFNLGAADFLLKSFDAERFLLAVDKVRKKVDAGFPVRLEQVLPYFFIQSDIKGKLIRVVKDDIVYVESALNYVHIHLYDRSHLTYLTIREMEDRLHSPQFIRVHKSFMINLEKVVSVEGNRVTLVNNVKIGLGPSYRDVFFERLSSMMIRSKRLG